MIISTQKFLRKKNFSITVQLKMIELLLKTLDIKTGDFTLSNPKLLLEILFHRQHRIMVF